MCRSQTVTPVGSQSVCLAPEPTAGVLARRRLPCVPSGADAASSSEGEGDRQGSVVDTSVPRYAEGSDTSQEKPVRPGWRHRRTVRALRREAARRVHRLDSYDQRENKDTWLPEGETVHFGGLVLAEAFTPSTVSALYRALENLPSQKPEVTRELIAQLQRNRSALRAGGWSTLGVVRRPGAFVLFDDLDNDPTLPDCVDAVWLRLFYLTPSLAMVVATFTFTEEAGDVTRPLRADYRSESFDVRLHILGRFGRMREKIPWSRPASYRLSHGLRGVVDQKMLACESVISRYEAACWQWFSDRFPGRFSAEKISNRPCVRLLLTKDHNPSSGPLPWLRPVGLGSIIHRWRSTDPPGWIIDFRELERERCHMAIAAFQRGKATDESGSGEDKDTVWYITQQFHDQQSSLIARWATSCLISIYADRLGGLRDRAGIRYRLSRPVRQARDLDRYLIGDGLDAATVAADMDDFTGDVARFRRNVPEYGEELSAYPEEYAARHQPLELVPVLAESLRTQAARLSKDMAIATANIRASAELRQAIANTRLQRILLALTVIATVIAVISLVVA